MSSNLYYNTVTPLLLSILKTLMASKEFDAFRLVGGTALSLYKGHRESVDIDLFSDAKYGSIDFEAIDVFLHKQYEYVAGRKYDVVGMGRSYSIGSSKENSIKLDIFYTDEFVYEMKLIDGIRMASEEEIIAMKLEFISAVGRKKDFWDLHEFIEIFSIEQMLRFHEMRNPYNHNSKIIRGNFSNFTIAEEEPDPICLRGKYWHLIKLDIMLKLA